jgi:hypothetical protein
MLGAPFEVLPSRVEDREVDCHLGVGVAQRLWARGHLEAGPVDPHLVEVDAGVMRVDRGHELELGIVDDGLADVLTHSPTGPENADSDHALLLLRRRPRLVQQRQG